MWIPCRGLCQFCRISTNHDSWNYSPRDGGSWIPDTMQWMAKLTRAILKAVLVFIVVVQIPQTIEYVGFPERDPLMIRLQAMDRRGLHGDGDVVIGTQSRDSIVCEMLGGNRGVDCGVVRGEGVGIILLDAVRTSIEECGNQFHNERWNCSLERYGHKLYERGGLRETGFIHAISSAGLVHHFARACSVGRLEGCTCDDSFSDSDNRQAWQWGGCGDNTKFGLKFTRRFLRSRKWGHDLRAKVDRHNSDVGMRVVKSGVQTTCKCHGVSGSCTMTTCWRQISPFHHTGSAIKRKYDNAKRVVMATNGATGKDKLIKFRQRAGQSAVRKGDLVYVDPSPDFCTSSIYSPGTRGRECIKGGNCDKICCGRGYNIQRRVIAKRCHCKVIWCCQVQCRVCLTEEEFYTCK